MRLHLIEIANLHKKNNMGKLSPVFFYKCGGGNIPLGRICNPTAVNISI